MKKNIIKFFTMLLVIGCQSQSKIDLAEVDLSSPLDKLIDKETAYRDIDLTTSLFYYKTYDTDKYHFKTVNFESDYPKDDYIKTSIGFLINNYEENQFLGFYISTKNFNEGEELLTALKQKYGEPITINIASSGWSVSGYYYKKTQDGFDILISQIKNQSTSNGKTQDRFSTDVHFIKSGLKFRNMPEEKTVLEYFIYRME